MIRIRRRKRKEDDDEEEAPFSEILYLVKDNYKQLEAVEANNNGTATTMKDNGGHNGS